MKGSRGWPREDRGRKPATSYEAEAAEIENLFRTKLAGLRRRLRPSEIPAAVRALREEKAAALRAMRERRAAERFSERELRRRGRTPPQKPQRPSPG